MVMSGSEAKLLGKLWKALVENGISALLKPWNSRINELETNSSGNNFPFLLEEAARELEEIKSGKCAIYEARYDHSNSEKELSETKNSSFPQLSFQTFEMVKKSADADLLRKEINVAKAILYAEDELKRESSVSSNENIEADWLYRWRENAGNVSVDELQAIWGRILAGECTKPGTYSYRLLDFIKNLTKNEALLIQEASSLVINNFIVRDAAKMVQNGKFNFEMFLELQELGILSGVESIGLTLTLDSANSDRFIRILPCHCRGVLVEHPDSKKKLTMKVYTVTAIGKQVLKLGIFQPNDEYLEKVSFELIKEGFSVSIVDYEILKNDEVRYFNKEELKKATDNR